MTNLARIVGAALMATASVACSGTNKAQAVRDGDALETAQQHAEAAAAYQRALDVDPSDADLRVKLGQTYLRAGDAIRAADLLPEDLDAQLRAASTMLGGGRFSDVLGRADALLRAHPDNPSALVLKANALARLPNSIVAMERLAPVLANDTRRALVLSDLQLNTSRSADDEAARLFQKAITLSPAIAEPHFAWPNFLWARGRLDEAESPLRVIAEPVGALTTAKFALGVFLALRSRPDEAQPLLQAAAAASGPAAVGARLTLADLQSGAGRLDEARAILEPMSTDDPDGEASVRLAALDGATDKPADAVRRLDTLLRRLPLHPQALFVKAQVLNRMGNPDLRYARAAVAADPKSSEARALLGEALSSQGDVEDALQQYVEAVQLNPNSAEASVALGRSLLTLGRVPEAALRARDAVRIAPGSKDAVLLLVTTLVRQRNYVAAERTLAPLQTSHPHDPGVALQAGLLQTALGQTAAARASLTKALTYEPDSSEALGALIALEPAGRPSPDVLARLDAAVQRRPRDASLLMLKARALAAGDDTTGAGATLMRAFEVDRSNVAVALALADALNRTHRVDAAATVLRQVLERRPRSVEARTALATMLDDAGRDAEAQPLYEQIVDEHPEAAMVAYRLGLLYLAKPELLSVALDLAVAAKRGLPDEPAVNDLLGQVYTKKGLTSLALGPLREAIAADPRNALYRYHLGEAYERAGNRVQARTEYAAALAIDSNFPGADRIRPLVGTRR